MAIVDRNALVEHSASQMYELVNAVQQYPEFLPWCTGAEILEQSEQEMRATLKLSKAGVKQQFTTSNKLQYPGSVHMSLVDGPFRKLDGLWEFKALAENACKVSLRLEFEFSSALLEKVVGPVFNQIANTMLDAFVKRAEQVYG